MSQKEHKRWQGALNAKRDGIAKGLQQKPVPFGVVRTEAESQLQGME